MCARHKWSTKVGMRFDCDVLKEREKRFVSFFFSHIKNCASRVFFAHTLEKKVGEKTFVFLLSSTKFKCSLEFCARDFDLWLLDEMSLALEANREREESRMKLVFAANGNYFAACVAQRVKFIPKVKSNEREREKKREKQTNSSRMLHLCARIKMGAKSSSSKRALFGLESSGFRVE